MSHSQVGKTAPPDPLCSDNEDRSQLFMCGFSHHTTPFQTASPSLPAYLFRLQTEGIATALIDGDMRIVKSGDLLLYPPGSPYQLNIQNYDHTNRGRIVYSSDYYLSCQGNWIDQWWQRHTRQTRIRIPLDEHLISLWRMLILEKRKLNKQSDELIEMLLRSLCLMIDQLIEVQYTHNDRSFIAYRMKAFIEDHATASFRVRDLAEHVGLSVSRTTHLFKQFFGQSILDYALEVRIAIAKERMLYSSLTLEQIAVTCGFGSYSYLYRVFRKKTGMTPAQYRKKKLDLLP